MAKDPAFLFYPGDFNTGTQFFNDEQVGKYMRLLMAQHQHGHLTEDQVIFICKSYDKQVMSKFTKDAAGLWFNERLELEIIKRKKFVESRSKNKEGKTKSKIISNSYDSHMENENRNENEIIIGIKKEYQISVLKKYANDKTKIIYDLQLFFATTGQLEALQRAGWIDFDGFMRANPSATFNDDGHVYNSFRKYQEGKKNGTKKLTYDDVK